MLDEFDAWPVVLTTSPVKAPSSGYAGSQHRRFQACGLVHEGIMGREETLEGGAKVTVDENYVRESILVPAAKIVAGYPPTMPSFQGQLSDEEVGNLIDYIKTLSE